MLEPGKLLYPAARRRRRYGNGGRVAAIFFQFGGWPYQDKIVFFFFFFFLGFLFLTHHFLHFFGVFCRLGRVLGQLEVVNREVFGFMCGESWAGGKLHQRRSTAMRPMIAGVFFVRHLQNALTAKASRSTSMTIGDPGRYAEDP